MKRTAARGEHLEGYSNQREQPDAKALRRESISSVQSKKRKEFSESFLGSSHPHAKTTHSCEVTALEPYQARRKCPRPQLRSSDDEGPLMPFQAIGRDGVREVVVSENQCGGHVATAQSKERLEPEEQRGKVSAAAQAAKMVAESKVKMRSP